jgi:hypothetical protein
MVATLRAIAAAAVLTAAGSIASAGSISVGQPQDGIGNSVIKVHGNHRSCERGPGGWHRHNRFGERRPCRRWHGQGRRPDYCVRVGPVYYCDY